MVNTLLDVFLLPIKRFITLIMNMAIGDISLGMLIIIGLLFSVMIGVILHFAIKPHID